MNFTDEARVTAAGNSNLPLSYSHNDLLPASVQSKKAVFYRLQSVDKDGQFSYSQVVMLRLDMKEMELLVSPNPAKDILQVQTGSTVAGEAALFISDAAGRQLYQRNIVLQQGTNSIPINISDAGQRKLLCPDHCGNRIIHKAICKDRVMPGDQTVKL